MKIVDQIDLKNKAVLLRTDLNVPYQDGRVSDDYRLKATLPTVKYILDQGAKLIICAHHGRPKQKNTEDSLRPAAERLSELLGKPIQFLESCIGPETESAVKELKFGEVIVLENLRFHPGEEGNDDDFGRKLASYCDVYVNDAFASYQGHTSVIGVPKFVKEKAAGFVMRDEITTLEKAFSNPKRPLTAVFGGAKVSTKMAAIRFAGAKADRVVIGGAMANTFFVAQGLQVGKSLYEPAQVEQAKLVIKEFEDKGVELLLPVDVVVASELKQGTQTKTVKINEIPADLSAFDIGAKSSELFEAAVKTSATIIWNGPMGAFETETFAVGTNRLIQSIAQSSGFSIVGGGDTDLALHRSGSFEKMGYVSTAGGAFMQLLEGNELPAVKALNS